MNNPDHRQAIKNALEKHGKTQSDLVKKFGFNQSALNLFLNNKRGFPIKHIEAIMEDLGLIITDKK